LAGDSRRRAFVGIGDSDFVVFSSTLFRHSPIGKRMLSTPIGRLRFIGFVEGMSYLVLLLVAMPLKYWAAMTMAVRIVGSAHGGLFVLFFLSVAEVSARRGWWTGSFWGKAFLASIVPLGTFVFDRWLKRQEAADEPASSTAG